MKRFSVFVFCVFLFSQLTSAQTDIFDSALNLFKSGKYSEAQNYLENQLALNPNPAEEQLVLLAKIYNHTAQFEKNVTLSLKINLKKPNNLQEFWFEVGFSQLQINDPNSALQSWIKSYESKPETGEFVKENMELLLTRKINLNAQSELSLVQNLIETVKDDSLKTYLLGMMPGTDSHRITEVRIGLLLPIGKNNPNPTERELIGRDILHGFLVGMNKVELESAIPTELFVMDTEGDSIKAEQLGRELITEKKVNLIIGPVFSNECKSVAALAEQYKIPVISPTASDDGIGKFKNYFFQLNPSLEVRGKQSALKALEIQKIEKDTVLVLSEKDSETGHMADAFSVSMHENNITVVDRAVYDYGEQDIRRYLPYVQQDTTQIKDIIYAPIEDESLINIIVPQLSYLKVFGFYVGNTHWDDILKLRQYKRILDGMLICKDFNIDTSQVEVKNYIKNYQSRFHSKPTSISYRGYDSYLFVKSIIENGYLGKSDVDVSIRKMPPVKGLQNTIDFRGETVNQHLVYFRYINNQIIPADNVEQQQLHTNQ